MDKYPKFIIETDDELGDCLIISKCTYHRDLVVNRECVKGGGWFHIKENKLTLYESSDEFGAADVDDIKSCIENGNVYTNPFMTSSIANKYEFLYNTGSEIIKLN